MLTVHSLTLDHVAGVEHAHLDLPDTGVVVVYGPNEMGKSTLLTAFQLLLSDLGVGTKKGWVKALKSATLDEPTTISATLTAGEYHLSVLKSFNKGGGRCELAVTAPKQENLTGRQAAERFAEIIAGSVDTQLIDALTIKQGASLDILPIVGIRSLEQVLELEANGVAVPSDSAGEDAGELIAKIGSEYSRYYTASGRPTKDLLAAERERDSAASAHSAAQLRYSQAQGLINELERLLAEKHAIVRQEPEVAETTVETKKALEQGQIAVAELERHRGALAVAQGALDIAEQRHGVRVGKVQELAESESTIAGLEVAVEEASTAAADEENQSSALRAQLGAVQLRSRVAKAWSGYLTAAQRREELLEQLEDIQQRIDDAAIISQEIRDIGVEVRQNPATSQAIEALRSADSALHQAISIRDAVATAVEIAGPPEDVDDHSDDIGAGSVLVDGEKLSLVDGSTTVHVTGRQVLGLGDYTVTITPARDVREVSEDVARASEELIRQCADLGVEGLEEAEELAIGRQESQENLQEASLRLAQIIGDSTPEVLGERRDDMARCAEESALAMAQSLERIRVEDPEGTTELHGIPRGPAVFASAESTDVLEGISADIADLDQLAEYADQEADRLHNELDRVTRSAASVRWESRRAELIRARAVRDRLNGSLMADRDQTSDIELAANVDRLRVILDEAQQALTATQSIVGDIDVDVLAALAANASTRERRLHERAVETGSEISRVTGALGEHNGVAEQCEAATALLERTEWKYRRVMRQAAAAERLFREVDAALRAARERYEAPLRKAIERLASILYATPAHVEFDEELRVERRFLDGVALDTAQLSGGAREQLAVLSRLAVADLVGRGESVPVIIDDALGFSDRGRIEKMNVVLDALGKDHQIIVLTCDRDRFDGIAGAEVIPMNRVLGHSS